MRVCFLITSLKHLKPVLMTFYMWSGMTTRVVLPITLRLGESGASMVTLLVDSSFSNLPEVLYHGTKDQFIKSVMKDGLKHMDRNFVHLTPSVETARKVANRRSGKSVILKVSTRDLIDSGYTLYKSGEVYLIEHVAPSLLSFA